MARCTHGFETSVVPCTRAGCASPRIAAPPSNKRGRVEDITGRTLAGATVIARAENVGNGSAGWVCRLPCGHAKTIAGGHLRQQERLGGKIRCAEDCSTYKRPAKARADAAMRRELSKARAEKKLGVR